MGHSNAKAYVLVASGAYAVCDGQWRSFCRDAFMTSDDADDARAGFLERCKAARDEPLGPDPDSLSVRVVPLDLAQDLDSSSEEVFLLTAEGRDTVFERILPFIHGTLYASRERAEAAMPGFLDKCADPDLGDRYSLRENLRGRMGTLTLRPPSPEPTASPSG